MGERRAAFTANVPSQSMAIATERMLHDETKLELPGGGMSK